MRRLSSWAVVAAFQILAPAAPPSAGYTAGLRVLACVAVGDVNFLVGSPAAGSLTPGATALPAR